jgi:hypothetical protein
LNPVRRGSVRKYGTHDIVNTGNSTANFWAAPILEEREGMQERDRHEQEGELPLLRCQSDSGFTQK